MKLDKQKAFLDSLPSPELLKSNVVYHEGLAEDTLDELKARGFDPRDVRFLDPEEQILGTISGAVLGTCFLDQTRANALRLAAQIHGLLDKDRAPKDDSRPGSISELLDALSATPAAPRRRVSKPEPTPVPEPEPEVDEITETVRGAVSLDELNAFFSS